MDALYRTCKWNWKALGRCPTELPPCGGLAVVFLPLGRVKLLMQDGLFDYLLKCTEDRSAFLLHLGSLKFPILWREYSVAIECPNGKSGEHEEADSLNALNNCLLVWIAGVLSY